MEKMPKELLKEYVNSQNFTSTADISFLDKFKVKEKIKKL